MQLEFWGATAAPHVALPERALGYVLLAIYILILAVLVYRRRSDFERLSSRQRLIVLALAVLSWVCSQLFLITLPSESQLPPLSIAQNPEAILAPFSFAPFLLVAAILNPLAAMIVGFVGGLGWALWQTHQLFDPFNFAFAAMLAAWLMQQHYSGRLYRWLRQPIASGLFAALLILPLSGLAAFVYADAGASNLEALDLALSASGANIAPLLIEGILGGLIVTLLVYGVPELREQRALQPSPLDQSLNTRLVATFVVFAGLLSVLLVIIGFNVAIGVATDLAIQQLAQDASTVSAQVPEFRAHRQNLLVQLAQGEELEGGSREQKEAELRDLFRRGDFFRSIVLLDGAGRVEVGFPEDTSGPLVTNLERTAVEETLATAAPLVSPAQELEDGDFFISFITPIVNSDGEPEGALIGRVPDVSLDELVTGLQGTLGEGIGFLVDEQGQVIGHPDVANLLKDWAPPVGEQNLIDEGSDLPGVAFQGPRGSTNARQLIYYQTGPDHPWTITISLPYQVILGQALRIAGQLAIVLVGALVLFGIALLFLGHSITQPLIELARASQEIASGSLDTAIRPQGSDEIGRLGEAFGQMQTSLKRRLDELSLLLDVSQEVSKSIDINRGMPSILKGALRGTGAAGVRIVVLNPSGRRPLTFGEGPASENMSSMDRQVMSLLRQQDELVLPTPQSVSHILSYNGNSASLPKALIAIPLATRERFQGVFWLTYRQPHRFDLTELNFLRMLSGQASVLVENARLFATAEGGRRRLAAVLSSTSDAVIVTDQTERILLINPAMERFFDLKASEVVGRPLKVVIQSEPLVEALATNSKRTRHLEIPVDDDRVLYASASTILNNEGQALGRVAVLHDITYLKEIDEMKSEFVATVSHDLRSPLTYMLGYATMLPMIDELHPTQHEYMEKILIGIEQMSVLIDNLLDLGRLEAGVDLVLSQIRVEEVLSSVAHEYRTPARTGGLELVVEIEDDIPMVQGDVSLVRQALTNYVANAIKYAPDSGKIVIGARLEDDEVVIYVTDNGPGISVEDQRRLFEKFYRIKHPASARIKGSGLGLALVRSIAERHGGRAWCESQRGVGSSFYFSLPVRADLDQLLQ